MALIGQMVRQYPWLYERTSPFTYQPRAGNAGNDGKHGCGFRMTSAENRTK